jgi:tetratricopeptide (TPR) repeat protein
MKKREIFKIAVVFLFGFLFLSLRVLADEPVPNNETLNVKVTKMKTALDDLEVKVDQVRPVKVQAEPEAAPQVEASQPVYPQEQLERKTKLNQDLHGQMEELKSNFSALEDKLSTVGQTKNEARQLRQLLESQEESNSQLKDDVERLAEKLKNEIGANRQDIEALSTAKTKESAQLYEYLATAYVYAQLYKQAVWALEKSLEYNKDNPRVYYYLGLLYQYAYEDSEKSVAFLKLYLKSQPKGIYADKAKGIIDILVPQDDKITL